MSSELLERTKKELRALLISAPRGVNAFNLAKDYKMVTKKELPWRELGYRNLHVFVRSIPDVIREETGPDGQPVYKAIPNKETATIARMVASQKKPPLKKAARMTTSTPAQKRNMHFTSNVRSRPRAFFQVPTTSRGRVGAGGGNWAAAASNRAFPRANTSGSGYGGGRFYSSGTRGYGRKPPPSSSSSSHPLDRGGAQFTFRLPGSVQATAKSRSLPSTPVTTRGGTSLASIPGGMEERLSEDECSSITSDGSSRGSLVGGGARGVVDPAFQPWREHLNRAPEVSISSLTQRASTLVCVIGNACSLPYLLTPPSAPSPHAKILLFTILHKWTQPPIPAVMLYFRPPYWDFNKYPGPLNAVQKGTKIRAYGRVFIQAPNKKGYLNQPAIEVEYCEIVDKFSNRSAPTTPTHHQTSLTLLPLPSTSTECVRVNEEFCRNMVYQALKRNSNGVWGRRLKKALEKDYDGRSIPNDIGRMAESYPFVYVDRSIQDNPILHLSENALPPSSPIVKTSASSQAIANHTPSHAPNPVASKNTPLEKPLLPSTVSLKTGDTVDVCVALVESPVSFYVQIVGEDHLAKLDPLEEELARLFKARPPPPVAGPVGVDSLCAFLWEDGTWCRAVVTSVTGAEVEVFFPDYGNCTTANLTELKELPYKFYQLPFQAVHCCLYGISEDLSENSHKVAEKFKELVKDNCVAQVKESTGTLVSLELIEQNASASGLTVNTKLLLAFRPIASLRPALPKPGPVEGGMPVVPSSSSRVPVKLMDMTYQGALSVQLVGAGLTCLQQLMTQLSHECPSSEAISQASGVREGLVYCARFGSDPDNWYRVGVIKKHSTDEEKFLVRYIDYGNEESLHFTELKMPPKTDLISLPPQAIKCVLHDVSFLEKSAVSRSACLHKFNADLVITINSDINF